MRTALLVPFVVACTPAPAPPAATAVPVASVSNAPPIASVPTSTSTSADTGADCDRLPKSWNTDAMLTEGLNLELVPGLRARVLAWQIDRDERPLVVERVLLWVHHHRGAQDFWMLAHLYRHPLDATARWHTSMVTDVPYKGTDTYSTEPTRKELDTFLQETWWRFEPSGGFDLVGAEVCARAWTRSFGAAPWHAYRAAAPPR